jgi:hypothetical protein
MIYAVTTENRLTSGSQDPTDVTVIYTFDTPEAANEAAQERADAWGRPTQVYAVMATGSVFQPQVKV